MKKLAAVALLCLVVFSPSYAVECEALKIEIEQKIGASAVTNFTLRLTEAAASAPGKLVGTCENGTKKIHYVQGTANEAQSKQAVASGNDAGTPIKPRTPAMLTECKAGFSGPDCRTREKAQ